MLCLSYRYQGYLFYYKFFKFLFQDKLRCLQEKEYSLRNDLQRFESYINELEMHRQSQDIVYKEAEDINTNTGNIILLSNDHCLQGS